jgi:hypothetical protein
MIVRDDHIESNGRRLDLRSAGLNRQVRGFIERLAVDRKATGFIATDNVIARHADYTFDQVLGAGIGQYADKLERLADRTSLASGAARKPPAGIGEDNDLSSLDAAELLYDDAIIDLQCVLHRNRRNYEHLADKSAQ